jgi:hypothetical protein
MSTFSLEQLTEGIRQRHLGSQNRELTEKWARTGLLKGLDGVKRENMARLMENQAAQVLKEQSSLSNGGGGLANSGDMRGFTNIAFPIVRRVFGGLIANDLVSIQPMSLPSGLLFYLDYTRPGLTSIHEDGVHVISSGSSAYGDPVGSSVQTGADGKGGLYDLAGSAYSRVHSAQDGITISNSGSFSGADGAWRDHPGDDAATHHERVVAATGSDGKAIQFDPQLTSLIEARTHAFDIKFISLATGYTNADTSLVKEWGLDGGTCGAIDSAIQTGNSKNVRRLNQLVTWDGTNYEPAPLGVPGETANLHLLTVCSSSIRTAPGLGNAANDTPPTKLTFPIKDSLTSGNGSSVVVPSFESDFGSTPSPAIPEIDIKVEALPVVAQSRKLRARWSPELAQDLNAYHSLDAEVELTQILSEQIALEIDREVLNDLLTQAGAANYYWSRAPGRFLNKETGAVQDSGFASFTGTVREWYETLVETIIDVANQIHRKTLRGSANFIVVGPDVATILEASVLYKPSYSLDGDGQVSGMVIGAEKVGTLSNRFTVYKDPYFPRNKVLVGYKGGSYLETGYVYAPYVPLIVTPTIFAPEDFTPRKGVMTRYGKKMVRADFYGTVTCADMSVI